MQERKKERKKKENKYINNIFEFDLRRKVKKKKSHGILK